MEGGTLVVGSITRDYVDGPVARLDGELGGSATYFALAARLFGPVRVVAGVGTDAEAEARALMEFADLSALTVAEAPTPAWRARRESTGGEATTLERFTPAITGYQPSLHEADWPRVVFLGSHDPRVQLAVARAAPPDTWLAGDTMDVFIQERRSDVEQVLRASRLAFLTETELEVLTRTRGIASGAAAVMDAFNMSAIVVKRGQAGALLWTREGAMRMRAPEAVVVDPTGAGDALAGGCLGRLAQLGRLDSEALRDCLECGMVTAAFAIEGIGTARLRGLSSAEFADRLSRYRAATAG